MCKMRTFCADSPYGDKNCPYANVVEETGEFPVIIESFIIDAQGDYKLIEKKQRIETQRYAVYCTHPMQKNRFVGIVEPYGGYCDVPIDCPEIRHISKITIWQKLKAFFIK